MRTKLLVDVSRSELNFAHSKRGLLDIHNASETKFLLIAIYVPFHGYLLQLHIDC